MPADGAALAAEMRDFRRGIADIGDELAAVRVEHTGLSVGERVTVTPPFGPHASTAAELKARIEAERRGTPFLAFRDADGSQALLELEQAGERITIGRRADSHLSLPGTNRCRALHAQLERIGGDWTLVDEGLSRNGSYVNGKRIAGRQRLRDGDRLCFGATIVVFSAPTAERVALDAGRPEDRGGGARSRRPQREVLIALCRPLAQSAFESPATNRQIAEEIHLSVDAVKAHLGVMFERFGLGDLPQNRKRARLAATALVNGIVVPHDL